METISFLERRPEYQSIHKSIHRQILFISFFSYRSRARENAILSCFMISPRKLGLSNGLMVHVMNNNVLELATESFRPFNYLPTHAEVDCDSRTM